MYKFFLPSCRLNLRKFSLSQRVVSEWNSLTPKSVNQATVNGFKNIIDNIFRKRRGLHICQNRLSAPVLMIPISVHYWWDPVSYDSFIVNFSAYDNIPNHDDEVVGNSYVSWLTKSLIRYNNRKNYPYSKFGKINI